MKLPVEILALGLIVGSTYGILAVGLVLIYRSNRIINFAHGQIGAFAAACAGVLIIDMHIPYWIAFATAVLLAALVGALVETAVIRRLRNAPRLMSVIATLGFSQFLVAMQGAVANDAPVGALFPQPAGMPVFHVGTLLITPAYSAMLVFTPLTVAGLAIFLRRTPMGMAIRAAAANRDAALLSGIFASRMSTIAWAIAGGVSCLTAMMLLPTGGGFTSGDAFGPSLLLRALAAGVVGRMNNLPVTFAAGVTLGVVERVMAANQLQAGTFDIVLFGAILGALLVLRPRGAREDDRGSVWATVQGWRPLPDAYRRAALVRHGSLLMWTLAFAVAILLPAMVSFSTTVELITIYAIAIAGLSVGVVTGLAGQLSLGQFAIAGVGATVCAYTAERTGDFPLAVLMAAAAGAGASIIVGLPALRIRGVMLAVTTLAFALMAREWLLLQPWMLGGSGKSVSRPLIGNLSFQPSKTFYYFALFFLALAVVLSRQVWRGGMGRIMLALRDNEDAARSFTVAATARKLQAFGIAGGLAGVSGAIFAFAIGNVTYSAFAPQMSIEVLATAVIGGIGLLAGPIIGAFYIFGIPAFLPLDSASLAATSLGWLVLILYLPGGLASVLEPVRTVVARTVARWSGVDVDAADAQERSVRKLAAGDAGPSASVGGAVRAASLGTRTAAIHAMPLPGAADAQPLLAATNLAKHFGGVVAVKDVSIEVRHGETLGLIGPNGAGKTTLFELLSGFTRPDSGEIVFDGQPLTRAVRWGPLSRLVATSPERRGHLGLIRSFQDAALFPTMTVEEVVCLAQERVDPTRLLPSVMGTTESEHAKRDRARELIAMMGLEDYRRRQVSELSTGTRRVAELCALLALEPRLLLLDEPSSGIAQRETEALGALLRRVKQHLGTTMVVIEHDIPLVMGLSDRVIAMEAGGVIAAGSPAEVRSDPRVVEAYLGGDVVAIERSGAAVPQLAAGMGT